MPPRKESEKARLEREERECMEKLVLTTKHIEDKKEECYQKISIIQKEIDELNRQRYEEIIKAFPMTWKRGLGLEGIALKKASLTKRGLSGKYERKSTKSLKRFIVLNMFEAEKDEKNPKDFLHLCVDSVKLHQAD